MFVKNLRWGKDGDPADNTITEIMVTDKEGANFFVLVSRAFEEDDIRISSMPMFDIAVTMTNGYNVAFDHELRKLDTMTEEHYSFELNDVPENELNHSKFGKVIRLARAAMDACENMSAPDYESAQAFIRPFIDQNVNKMPLPETR
ncbi:MAG: hypothetical protein Q4B73_05080 [Lachnospiraceae bacterium]|nr:hypothetical protein [Lachnospiraceae bacterium]